ncbi:hypothetical protein Tco_1405212, partial [Tanacetum coccineum]
MITNGSLRIGETSSTITTTRITVTITTATMITTSSKMKGRKPLGLMETVDIIDLIPCVGSVHCITQDLALSGVRIVTKSAIRLETVEAENFCFQISLYHSTKSRDEISVRLRVEAVLLSIDILNLLARVDNIVLPYGRISLDILLPSIRFPVL